MTWMILLGFGAYVLAIRAAREAWQKRWLRYGKTDAACGMTGTEVAKKVLASDGVEDVSIVRGRAWDTARYDAVRRRVVLGPGVHDGRSVGAVFLAAQAATESLPDLRREAAGGWRRWVTGFGRSGVGIGVLVLVVAGCFRPVFFRMLPLIILLGGVVLLLGHGLTLGWEYRVARVAARRLDGLGLVGTREEEAFGEMAKAVPLREVTGIFQSVGRVVGSLLPFRGWR